MRLRSARALRESYLAGGMEDEPQTLFVRRTSIPSTGRRRQAQSSILSSLLFGSLLAIAIYFGAFGLPQGGAISAGKTSSSGSALAGLTRMFRPQVKLAENFKSGLGSWTAPALASNGGGWAVRNGLLQPGKLRIWKDSAGLTDYRFDFAGQIENKGFGWAVRVADARNYYASKLIIKKPGPLPVVDFVRYAVVDGSEVNRSEIPLPMTVRSDTLYKVEMSVTGSDFSAMVNGQMVDTWTDSRFRAGGVGFFAEGGEVALLRYAHVTSTGNLLGNVLSHLGMLHPSMLP